MAREQAELQKALDEQMKHLETLRKMATDRPKTGPAEQQPEKRKKAVAGGMKAVDKAAIEEQKRKALKEMEEMGKIYIDERTRQQKDLAAKQGDRHQKRMQLFEEREKKKREEEELEVKRMKAKVEAERKAKEAQAQLRIRL